MMEKVFKRVQFQEDYMAIRQDLIKQKTQMLAQIKSLEGQVDNIQRTLEGWDLALIHDYQAR